MSWAGLRQTSISGIRIIYSESRGLPSQTEAFLRPRNEKIPEMRKSHSPTSWVLLQPAPLWKQLAPLIWRRDFKALMGVGNSLRTPDPGSDFQRKWTQPLLVSILCLFFHISLTLKCYVTEIPSSLWTLWVRWWQHCPLPKWNPLGVKLPQEKRCRWCCYQAAFTSTLSNCGENLSRFLVFLPHLKCTIISKL